MKKVITVICTLLINGCAGQQPKDLGIKNGKLKSCPDKPNCVSSFAVDERHAIKSINYTTTRIEAYNKIINIVTSKKNTKIIEKSDNYIRAEFRTKIMGFVDDVEFYFPEEKEIHLRSASRLGYSDWGVNRKRIENIRKLFNTEEGK